MTLLEEFYLARIEALTLALAVSRKELQAAKIEAGVAAYRAARRQDEVA